MGYIPMDLQMDTPRRTDCGEAGSAASWKQGVRVGRSCNMALGKKWKKMKFSSEEHINRYHKSFSNWITCFFHKFTIIKINFIKKQLISPWNHHFRLFCACRNLARRIFASRKLGRILVSDWDYQPSFSIFHCFIILG